MTTVPLKYRLFLLGLLPLIALLLYIRGQSYDPALIDFRVAPVQTSPAPVSAPLTLKGSGESGLVQKTGQIKGFSQLRQQRFTKENLYEHVNGHAEYFISAGFMGLTVTDYVPEGSKAGEPELSAEVYDMGRGIQAFGVLVDESGEKPAPVSIGSMGFKTSGGLNFIRGRYYVKVAALVPKAPVLVFARTLSETIPAEKDPFQIFSRLPDLGKVVTTRFIKEGYRGLDFVRNVVEREYVSGSSKINVALMTGSDQELRRLKSSFLDYFSKAGVRSERLDRSGIEAYKVMDKYEGNWFLIISPDAVFGVFGTDDDSVLKHFEKGKG
ncbi:MAG: hypothetical protein EPN25_10795 [Nitrospirae bacterium]|nr:MAG: hypothetical protein EPN25_10795 [Nitrospirota bacterium]